MCQEVYNSPLALVDTAVPVTNRLRTGSSSYNRRRPMSVCRSVLAMLALAALGAAPVASTQPGPPASFPPADMMTVGVYYYPEAWPREQWERDFANIRKHGFEFVHMAEFAWAFMEPQEGRFEFEWLERAVRLAAAQGLKVVLCTPSATPPAWLTRTHPETLMIDARGRRMNHGSREHATWSSPVYRRYVERIVTELGRRFGRNPNVWGWQIDNELSHYGRSYSYAPVNQEKFRVARLGRSARPRRRHANTRAPRRSVLCRAPGGDQPETRRRNDYLYRDRDRLGRPRTGNRPTRLRRGRCRRRGLSTAADGRLARRLLDRVELRFGRARRARTAWCEPAGGHTTLAAGRRGDLEGIACRR